MSTPDRAIAVPKPMLRVYEAIVGLTDGVCDQHLDSEYNTLLWQQLCAVNDQAQSDPVSLEAGLAASSTYSDG
jgi:hypothetical protein